MPHKETETPTDIYMEGEDEISLFQCPTDYTFWWRKSERR